MAIEGGIPEKKVEVGAEEEEEEEVEQQPVDTTVKKVKGVYKKVDLKVKQIVKKVPDIPEVTEESEKKPEVSIFSKDDAKFFSQMIWNLPPAIIGDYMEANEKLVKTFGEQLFSYCERKGLNPYDYLFDELGLLLATGAICADLGVKYRKHKKEEEKKEKEEETK